ncbi:hypothetical protein BC629DRAFT_1147315 [Irpex lacteus]|nr:hypothetical protein BC629DRAFT_1147315 [Irpex lacteus]
MSSPIAIPRVNVIESTDVMHSHSPAASSTSSSKYVPMHRRQASSTSTRSTSPPSIRAPSPAPSDASSWRSHSPASASPQNKKFPAKVFGGHHHQQHKGVYISWCLGVDHIPNNMSLDHAPSRTPIHNHIPQSSSIPSASKLPFTYSINDLLALSSSPATLSPSQVQSFEEVVSLLALPINNDKAAVRRRRNGRRSSKAAQVKQDVPVEVRRTRHGHGTWGWQTQHQVESLGEAWRPSAPQAIAVVA